MKVSELTGAALDWAVAKCIYEPDDVVICDGRVFAYDDATKGFNPSTNWAQGGPIIEREKIAVWGDGNLYWEAECGWAWGKGPTPLVAAMRCYVSSKVGEEIEVPEELQGEIA